MSLYTGAFIGGGRPAHGTGGDIETRELGRLNLLKYVECSQAVSAARGCGTPGGSLHCNGDTKTNSATTILQLTFYTLIRVSPEYKSSGAVLMTRELILLFAAFTSLLETEERC